MHFIRLGDTGAWLGLFQVPSNIINAEVTTYALIYADGHIDVVWGTPAPGFDGLWLARVTCLTQHIPDRWFAAATWGVVPLWWEMGTGS